MKCSRINPNIRRLLIHLTQGQDCQKDLTERSKEMKCVGGSDQPKGRKAAKRGAKKRLTTSLLS